jgi:hypothetical protein
MVTRIPFSGEFYPVSAEGSVVVPGDGDAGVVLSPVLVGEREQLNTAEDPSSREGMVSFIGRKSPIFPKFPIYP